MTRSNQVLFENQEICSANNHTQKEISTSIQTLIKTKRYDEAIKCLETELNYLNSKDDNKAQAPQINVQTMEAIQPIVKCLSNISYVHYLMHNYTESLEFANKALVYGEWYKIHYRLDKIYEAQGQYEEMCKEFDIMFNLLTEAEKNDKAPYMQDYYNRDVNFMRNWIIQSGGMIHDTLNIEYYDVDYRGMIVTNTIKNKMPLIKVPINCIISLEDSKVTNPYNKILVEKNINLNSIHSYLALELLFIRSTNDRRRPYINCLPKYFDNVPINFKISELQPLRESYAIIKILQKIYMLRTEYDNILTAIPYLPYTFAEFVWARTAVITRVYAVNRNGKQDTVLVPFADMANHEIPPNTKWSFDEISQQFIVESESYLKSGDVLYETYGCKCNYRYFVNYGFTINNNIYEEVALQFNSISRIFINNYINDIIDTKELQNTSIYDICEHRYKKDVIFNKLMNIIISEIEMFQIGYVYNEQVDKLMKFIRNNEVMSKQSEIKIHSTIVHMTDTMMSKFATSINDDEKLLQKYDFGFNYRNSIIMRLGEKKVLRFWTEFSSACLELLQSNDAKKIKKFNKKINKLKVNADFKTFNLYIKELIRVSSG